jgi:hypothetical protein
MIRQRTFSILWFVDLVSDCKNTVYLAARKIGIYNFSLMKISSFLFLMIIGLALITSSCTNDNEEDLYPEVICDSTNTTYTLSIAPVMATYCNSCHSTATATGGVITDNYTSLKPIAEGGLLWNVVNHNPGYRPMPESAPKLGACELAKIKNWVNRGAPEN